MPRGGARPGAGRKRRAAATVPAGKAGSGPPATPPSLGQAPSPEPDADTWAEARRLVGRYSALAVKVLVKIASNDEERATARVAAAAKLIELGRGADAGARLGKKEALRQAAETAGLGTDWGDDLSPPPGRPNWE